MEALGKCVYFKYKYGGQFVNFLLKPNESSDAFFFFVDSLPGKAYNIPACVAKVPEEWICAERVGRKKYLQFLIF